MDTVQLMTDTGIKPNRTRSRLVFDTGSEESDVMEQNALQEEPHKFDV